MKSKIPFVFYLIALIPPLTGAGNFIVAKATTTDIGPMSLLYWRWAVAWLVLFPFVIKDFKKDWGKIKRSYKVVVACTLPGIVLFNAFMYTALQHTTSINASIIANTFPVFIVILSYFILKERINTLKSLGILLALVGTSFITTNGQFHKLNNLFGNIGDVLALGGAFIFAGYSVALRFRPSDIKVSTFTFATISLGCLLIWPLYVWESIYIKPMVLNIDVIGTILFVAIPVSILGVISFNIAITKLGATTTGLIFYLAPVFNIILAQLFLGEQFTVAHFAGLCLILLGINLPLLGLIRKRV